MEEIQCRISITFLVRLQQFIMQIFSIWAELMEYIISSYIHSLRCTVCELSISMVKYDWIEFKSRELTSIPAMIIMPSAT